jgi:hypothetical protein
MDRSTKITFFALLLVQGAHSVEEYVFRFYEVFPPARLLGQLFPGFTQPGFVMLNSTLLLWGLWCFFARILQDRSTARSWAWAWVAIELFNGLAHPIWSLSADAYRPGLATSPLLLGLALYLAVRLRAASGPTNALPVAYNTHQVSGCRSRGAGPVI